MPPKHADPNVALINAITAKIKHDETLEEKVHKVQQILAGEGTNRPITDHADEMGMTALHHAISGHLNDIAISLLKFGFTVQFSKTTVLCDRGYTALHYAAMVGNQGIIPTLLEQNNEIDCLSSNMQTALYVAVDCQQYETAKYLMKLGADFSKVPEEDFAIEIIFNGDKHPLTTMFEEHKAKQVSVQEQQQPQDIQNNRTRSPSH